MVLLPRPFRQSRLVMPGTMNSRDRPFSGGSRSIVSRPAAKSAGENILAAAFDDGRATTVILSCALKLWYDALMSVEPAARARTMPTALTVATEASDDVHCDGLTVLASSRATSRAESPTVSAVSLPIAIPDVVTDIEKLTALGL
jgi:hypothetical protein